MRLRAQRLMLVGLLLACEGSRPREPERGPAVLPIDVSGVIDPPTPAWRRSGRQRVATGDGWRAVVDERGLQVATAHTSPVVFGPSSVRTGDGEAASAHVLTQSSATSVEFGGDVTETLQTTNEGVLQSWRFSRAPMRPGDVTVRIGVEAPFQGATSKGLRFGVPGAVVVYGHATWLDATRRATQVPAVFRRGAIELRVPSDVVAASRFPAVLDPSISPEFVASTPMPVLLAGAHERPAATWNGNGWTAVWHEPADGGVWLLSTRLSPDGQHELLGRHQAAGGLVGGQRVAIASSGDGRAVAVWASPTGEVRATRLGADGGGFEELVLGSGTAPDITWAGGSYVATWQTGGEVRARRVPAEGAPDAGWVLISADAGSAPRVAYDGTNSMVVWASTSADIVAARLSAADTVLDAVPIAVTATAGPEALPVVSCRAGACFVAWLDGSRHVLGTRVQGASVSAPVVEIEATEPAERVSVASRSSGVVVAWETPLSGSWPGSNLTLQRLEPTGTPHAQGKVRVRSLDLDRFAELAAHDEHLLLTWERSSNSVIGGTSAVAQVLGEDLGGVSFALHRGTARGPIWGKVFVAANRDGYLLVWGQVNFIGGSVTKTEVLSARVDGLGRVLDPGGRVLSDLGFYAYSARPAFSVASNGAEFLVAWASESYVFVLLDERGEPSSVLAPTKRALEGPRQGLVAGGEPAVVAGPSHFSVYWPSFTELGSADVTSTGALTTPARSEGPWSFPAPRTSSWAGSGVVVWKVGSTQLVLRHLTDAGHVDVTSDWPGGGLFPPAVGLSDTTTLLAGRGPDGGGFGRFVDRSGDAGGLFSLEGRPEELSWNGSRFVVANTVSTELVEVDGGRSSVAFASNGVACRMGQCLVVRGEYRDDGGASPIAAVLLSETQPPMATAQTVTTAEDVPLVVALSGGDPEGAALTAFVTEPPLNGRLSGQPPSVTYTPARDFFGQDRFSFAVSDGLASSTPVAVTVNVTAVNDAPVVQSMTVSTAQQPVAVNLSGVDVDGDPLSWQVVSGPDAGVLSGTAPALTYEPMSGFVGTDGFSFIASDGTAQSNVGQVVITVRAAVDAGAAGGGASGGAAAGGGSSGGAAAGGGGASGGSSGGAAAGGGGASGGGSAGGGSSGGSVGGGASGGSVGGGSSGGSVGGGSSGGSVGGGSSGGAVGGGASGGGSAGGGSSGGSVGGGASGGAGGGGASGGSVGGGASGGSSGGAAVGGGASGGSSGGGTSGGVPTLPAVGVEEQPVPQRCGCTSSGELGALLVTLVAARKRRSSPRANAR